MRDMDAMKYFERIGYGGSGIADEKTLINLHWLHIKSVPFENLDIHYKRPFDLHLPRVFHKVIDLKRGGFCYELNLLFHELLIHLGFHSRIVSARVYRDDGTLGPEFDHMAVRVSLKKDYLIDVGFGDLFVTPLSITEGQTQFDGRRNFVIDRRGDDLFDLSMTTQGGTPVKKYQFGMGAVSVEQFECACQDKQTNPESHFVKNTICTRATDHGRITLFNDRLVEKEGSHRTETIIASDAELRDHLRNKFGIVV